MRSHASLSTKAVRGLVRRNAVEEIMENAPLELLQGLLGRLDESSSTGAFRKPTAMVVVESNVSPAPRDTSRICEPEQIGHLEAEPPSKISRRIESREPPLRMRVAHGQRGRDECDVEGRHRGASATNGPVVRQTRREEIESVARCTVGKRSDGPSRERSEPWARVSERVRSASSHRCGRPGPVEERCRDRFSDDPWIHVGSRGGGVLQRDQSYVTGRASSRPWRHVLKAMLRKIPRGNLGEAAVRARRSRGRLGARRRTGRCSHERQELLRGPISARGRPFIRVEVRDCERK